MSQLRQLGKCQFFFYLSILIDKISGSFFSGKLSRALNDMKSDKHEERLCELNCLNNGQFFKQPPCVCKFKTSPKSLMEHVTFDDRDRYAINNRLSSSNSTSFTESDAKKVYVTFIGFCMIGMIIAMIIDGTAGPFSCPCTFLCSGMLKKLQNHQNDV